MADYDFNTPAGQTIDREMLVCYLNTGTATTPTWSPLGWHVSSGAMSYDMEKETNKDILGNTYTSMKKPTITQSFDAMPVSADNTAAKLIHKLAVIDQNVQALSAMDVMVAHYYVGADAAHFAERYNACAISVSEFGGDGGGTLTLSSEVTYGGKRSVGTAKKSGDTATFTEST